MFPRSFGRTMRAATTTTGAKKAITQGGDQQKESTHQQGFNTRPNQHFFINFFMVIE